MQDSRRNFFSVADPTTTLRVDTPATQQKRSHNTSLSSSRISAPNTLAPPPPPPHPLRSTSSESALPSQRNNEDRAPQLPPRVQPDRNRPLPQIPRVPVPSPDAPPRTNSTNPFEQNNSPEEDAPPPAYGAHQFDAYVDPQDADRVIREHQQRQFAA